jgi:glutamyl-tRNA reductase
MELQLFGINHKTTKLSERELFIINESNQEEFKNFMELSFGDQVESFVALSTCNRTEVYLFAQKSTASSVMHKTAEFLGCSDFIAQDSYILENNQALEHMCCVASGLDSQVLGEQEIFGQFKKAIQSFTNIKTLHGKLQQITDEVISIAKAARTETNIGVNPLSISGLSLKIVKEIFEEPELQKVTVVGAGQMALGVIDHFYDNGIKNIHAVNRTKKTLDISGSIPLETSNLSQLAFIIQSTDILIASIRTPLPIIGKGLIEDAFRIRNNKPMLLIDLGVPRNIEDQVRDIENAYLFSIEDMEQVTQENLEERTEEAQKAIDLIKDKVALVDSRLEVRQKKNSMYLDLQKMCSNLDKNEIQAILIADDPLRKIQHILKQSDDQLQYLSKLNSHEILSMLKEINSAR